MKSNQLKHTQKGESCGKSLASSSDHINKLIAPHTYWWWVVMNRRKPFAATSMCGRVRVYSREAGHVIGLNLRNNQVEV